MASIASGAPSPVSNMHIQASDTGGNVNYGNPEKCENTCVIRIQPSGILLSRSECEPPEPLHILKHEDRLPDLLTFWMLVRCCEIFEHMRQIGGMVQVIYDSTFQAIGSVIVAAHLLTRSGFTRSVDEVRSELGGDFPSVELDRLAYARLEEFYRMSVTRRRDGAELPGKSSDSLDASAGLEVMKYLKSAVDENATGKPYHSLPLLPIDTETKAACGWYDSKKKLYRDRYEIADACLQFLAKKSYDTEGIVEFAKSRVLPSVSSKDALMMLFSDYTKLAHAHALALEPPMESANDGENPEMTARRCCMEEGGIPDCDSFRTLGGILSPKSGNVTAIMVPLSSGWRAKYEHGCVSAHGLPVIWMCVPKLGFRDPEQKAQMENCDLRMRPLSELVKGAGFPFVNMTASVASIVAEDFSGDNLVAPEELDKHPLGGVLLYYSCQEGEDVERSDSSGGCTEYVACQHSDRLRKL